MEITKANGEKSIFDAQKLLNSLIRSGAQTQEAENIVTLIIQELYPGISTKKIYQKAFKLLKGQSRSIAARYNLKAAIMQLGPSGYPFEQFVGEILKHQGYTVRVAQIVSGKCVNHEVDVIAEKHDHHFMIECKYHNQPGIVCDVKIPLYINSRFHDVADQWQQLPGHEFKFHQGWVVTNTRFTADAIQYGNCAGLSLMSWDYPQGKGLKDLIDTLGLYPITTLTSLTIAEKRALLDKGIVLSHELRKNEFILKELNINPARMQALLGECDELCHHQKAKYNGHVG